MPHLRLKSVLLFSTCLCVAVPMAAQAQSIVAVPPDPSLLYTVSGDGSVAGGMDQSGSGAPFLYHSDGTVTDLSSYLPAGFTNGDVTELSYDGSVIVGNYMDAGGMTRGYVISGGVFADIGFLAPGVPSAIVRGVSSNGQVVVGSSSTAAGGNRAFRWDAANLMTALQYFGTATDADRSEAYGVNQDGSLVVGVSDDGTGVQHAVSWLGNAAPQDLGINAFLHRDLWRQRRHGRA